MKYLFFLIIVLSLFACRTTSTDKENYPCPVYDEDLQNIEGITETDESGYLIGEIDERDWHFDMDNYGFVPSKPVDISSFDVYLEDDLIVIHWVTQTETENAGWNIYRSVTDNFVDAIVINPSLIEGEGTTSEPTNYSYIDQVDYEVGQTYYYWLESISYSDDKEQYGPVQFTAAEFFYTVGPAYPNPSSVQVTIPYSLADNVKVTIIIIDEDGKLITTLISAEMPKGEHDFVWVPEDMDPGYYRCIYHVSEDYHWHGDIMIQ